MGDLYRYLELELEEPLLPIPELNPKVPEPQGDSKINFEVDLSINNHTTNI